MNNKPMSRTQRLQQGITLIELVSTLAIAGIISSMAIPGLSSLTANNRMTSAINSLVSHLHLARSEAIKRGDNIILCPSINGEECADGFEWHQGLMIFVDRDNSKTRDSDEEILRAEIPFSEGISIKNRGLRNKVKFNPRGSSPGYQTTFKFCHQTKHTDPRKVTLSNSGRPRVVRSSGEESTDCS